MSKGRQTRQRQTNRNPPIITHTDSIDLSSDAAFLLSHINFDNIFLSALISGQITNASFSNLYERSLINGWKQVLIELLNDLKLDEKTKPKRFMINRLIEENSTNANMFNEKVKILYEEINRQMSYSSHIHFQSIEDVYVYVDAWNQLQRERRLFNKEYNQKCSLPTLQQFLTDHFIRLINLLHRNPDWFLESGGPDALKRLFAHCFIHVVQPSGTDCVAVTKYEKVGQDFLFKIKTRIICLLDPDRIKEYLQLSNAGVTLYLKDHEPDSAGDVQSSLPWKTRTVMYNGTGKRTFLYVELNGNDWMKLTILDANRKPLYNKHLCQLEFQMKFSIIETNFEETVILESQLFGLCTHAKFTPEFLTKVFLEEIKQTYTAINLDTHINTLTGYVCELHKRISGVEAKFHTQQFIREELTSTYTKFCESGASPTTPVLFLTLDIYEETFKKFITQIKFLASHPFLSMMYYDSLFLGICSDSVDQLLINNMLTKPQIIIRFALFEEQEKSDNPNIIFTSYNGTLSKARITHSYLITDMSTCICETAKIDENQLDVFDYNETVPFYNFSRYYDAGLNHDSLIQTNDQIKYFPLKTLLRTTIRNNQVQSQTLNEQQMMTYTFCLSGPGHLLGNRNSIADATVFLQQQLSRWCGIQSIQDSLPENPTNLEFGNDIFDQYLNENHL